MKKFIRKWLGIEDISSELNSIDDFLFDRDAKLNGYRVGRKHLLTVKELDGLSWMGKPYKDKPDDR